MSIDSFIRDYGYFAVFLGVFIEGEAFVLTAGFLASVGLLGIEGVIAAAFVGSISLYNLCFLAGRVWGEPLLERFPKLRRRVAGVRVMLHRHHTLIIFGYRLLFGLRAVTPFALGVSGIRHRRFFALDLLPAAAWALAFSLAGFGFGEIIGAAFSELGRYWPGVAGLVMLLTLFIVLVLLRRYRRRLLLRRRNTSQERESGSK